MDSGYSMTPADMKAVTNGDNDFGGGGIMWIIVLFALFGFGGNGFGGGNRATHDGWSDNSFQTLEMKMDRLGQGICDSTYALNNSILTEGRAIQTQAANCCCEVLRANDATRFDMANYTASINANTTSGIQKILDKMCEDKMCEMQNQINQLNLQSQLCGVVRYPNSTTYTAGFTPFCNNNPCGGCGC